MISYNLLWNVNQGVESPVEDFMLQIHDDKGKSDPIY